MNSRIKELTVRGDLSLFNLFQEIDFFSDTMFDMIIATETPAEFFSDPKRFRSNFLLPACRGFAKAYLSGVQISEKIKESYFKAIKENIRRFFEMVKTDDYVWKVIILEKLLDSEDCSWIEHAAPNIVSSYGNDVFFFLRDYYQDIY